MHHAAVLARGQARIGRCGVFPGSAHLDSIPEQWSDVKPQRSVSDLLDKARKLREELRSQSGEFDVDKAIYDFRAARSARYS